MYVRTYSAPIAYAIHARRRLHGHAETAPLFLFYNVRATPQRSLRLLTGWGFPWSFLRWSVSSQKPRPARDFRADRLEAALGAVSRPMAASLTPRRLKACSGFPSDPSAFGRYVVQSGTDRTTMPRLLRHLSLPRGIVHVRSTYVWIRATLRNNHQNTEGGRTGVPGAAEGRQGLATIALQ
jgi:hypothetical protein